MTIGQLAQASEVPASTIRYYESRGVIPRAARRSGVREYGPDAVNEMKALRFYRAGGIPIRGLAAIGSRARGTAERTEVWRQVLQARFDDLETRWSEVKEVKRRLQRVIACRCNGVLEYCDATRAADSIGAANADSP